MFNPGTGPGVCTKCGKSRWEYFRTEWSGPSEENPLAVLVAEHHWKCRKCERETATTDRETIWSVDDVDAQIGLPRERPAVCSGCGSTQWLIREVSYYHAVDMEDSDRYVGWAAFRRWACAQCHHEKLTLESVEGEPLVPWPSWLVLLLLPLGCLFLVCVVVLLPLYVVLALAVRLCDWIFSARRHKGGTFLHHLSAVGCTSTMALATLAPAMSCA